jgi:hypothetical protein
VVLDRIDVEVVDLPLALLSAGANWNVTQVQPLLFRIALMFARKSTGNVGVQVFVPVSFATVTVCAFPELSV